MQRSTQRLILREFAIADAVALFEIERDPAVTRFMSYEVTTIEHTRAYLERTIAEQVATPRRVFDFAIQSRDRDEVIGRCGLRIDRPDHREAMLWYLLRPASWGQGLAREAAACVIEFAFTKLQMHRVWADCDPRNAASCRLAERLGMKLEGRLRENYFLKDEWCDTAVYGLLESEWPGRDA